MIQVVYIPWDDAEPLQSLSFESEEEIPKRIAGAGNDIDALNVIATILVRSHGLYAHHNPSAASSGSQQQQLPNVRATRLSMACGLLSMRLCGAVIISRQSTFTDQGPLRLTVDEIYTAACGSYDLRQSILEQVLLGDGCSSLPPEWLMNAARENYHDAAFLQRLASVMQCREDVDFSEDNDSDGQSDEQSSSGSDVCGDFTQFQTTNPKTGPTRTFVTHVPLCLECRRPTKDLCPTCEGAYFCSTTCRSKG